MTTDQQLDDDARGLAELGYAQELRRGMSAFSNFAISFSIISILAGCITSYRIALVSGGPSALTLGWLIVGLMVLAVALALRNADQLDLAVRGAVGHPRGPRRALR